MLTSSPSASCGGGGRWLQVGDTEIEGALHTRTRWLGPEGVDSRSPLGPPFMYRQSLSVMCKSESPRLEPPCCRRRRWVNDRTTVRELLLPQE